MAVAWTASNRNTDVRFLLNGTVVGTKTSAIQTVEEGTNKFNYTLSIPLIAPGNYAIVAEEIDTKAQTVRSTDSVNFSVEFVAQPISNEPNYKPTDSLWLLNQQDKLVPRRDRTILGKTIEADRLIFNKPGWRYQLEVAQNNWLATTRESAGDDAYGNMEIGDLKLHGALYFDEFSLIGSKQAAQRHWDGESYSWRLVGSWEGGEDAILVRRAKLADRALSADGAKSLIWSDTTIVSLLPGIQGEVNFRSCGNDLWKIKIDCLIDFEEEVSKTICQFPATFPRLYLSERIHIKDPAYGKSSIADFAHIHKDGSGETIITFDRPIVGLVRCIGSWVI
jgi:hypothetical protein